MISVKLHMIDKPWWNNPKFTFKAESNYGVEEYHWNIPSILFEHMKMTVTKLEGMRIKRTFDINGICSACGGNYEVDCTCDACNSTLDAAIKAIKND